MVTGCPEVRDTPYMGAVVLYLDLHNLPGILLHAASFEAGRDDENMLPPLPVFKTFLIFFLTLTNIKYYLI
jgi:hypothetical protein